MKETVLVVDDEPGVRQMLQAILRDEGYAVRTAGSGEDALDDLAATPADAVLLDVWLPGIDGLETLVRLRDRGVDAEVVMISGHGTIETAVRATKLGAFDFVEKPLSLERTLLVLGNALRARRLERRNRRLVEQLDRDTEIVGRSAAAARLRREVDAAAAADAPVLLAGPAGSGRETLARRIHARSSRTGEAFVAVACAAYDGRGAGDALFGSPGVPGRLALAAGGTLYLEDVERLPGDVQERLAADLEVQRDAPRGVRPLGGTVPGGAGLVPALRQQLEVIRIDLPPLAERREDVPVLAERFLRELAREYGREPKRFDPQTLVRLTAAPWPGNVRELKNLVERLVLLVPHETLQPSDLPEALGGARGPAEDLYRSFASLAEGIETFERYYIGRVLSEESGDRARAARRLGLGREVLEARIAALALA